MKKALLIVCLVGFLSGLCLFVLPSPQLAYAQSADTTGNIASEEFGFPLKTITPPGIQQSNWIQKGINYFAERVITVLATLAGSIAVLMMVIGGFRMIVSVGGDGYEKGKKMILWSTVGLLAVFGAYILVTTVQLLIKSIYG